jgi:glycerate 2-kinase
MFLAAVASADPARMLSAHLPAPPRGRCIVVGAGKAAAAMAAALDAAWPDVALSGAVVTAYGHEQPAGRIQVLTAAHPVPDENSVAAARTMLALVQNLTPEDLVIALISGGGSALLAAPAGTITLAEKQDISRALLASGAAIGEINTVRKQLSAIKGGKLAAAAQPARVVSLLISDIPGDDPALIASGPTIPDNSTAAQAREILARYRIFVPPAAASWLARERTQAAFPADIRMIATPLQALQAAAVVAATAGYTPLILGDALEGEAAQLGIALAGIARSCATHGHPLEPPCALISGGETSVTLGAGTKGEGGRNSEFCLSLAIELQGAPNIWALAADSDGIDGASPAAGAIVSPDSLRRASLNPRACLDAHDSYSFFEALGDLVVTGPTRTNVNDIRMILVDKP